MLIAHGTLSFNPLDWMRLHGKSSEEIVESMGKLNPNQMSIEKIDKCVVGVDKRIAEATAKRHSEMIDSIGVSPCISAGWIRPDSQLVYSWSRRSSVHGLAISQD